MTRFERLLYHDHRIDWGFISILALGLSAKYIPNFYLTFADRPVSTSFERYGFVYPLVFILSFLGIWAIILKLEKLRWWMVRIIIVSLSAGTLQLLLFSLDTTEMINCFLSYLILGTSFILLIERISNTRIALIAAYFIAWLFMMLSFAILNKIYDWSSFIANAELHLIWTTIFAIIILIFLRPQKSRAL